MQNKERNIYEGVITAMITPYKYEEGKQGKLVIDYDIFGDLVKKQLLAGIRGVVIAGSTGEGTCLKKEQVVNLLAKAKEIRSEYQNSSEISDQISKENNFAIICGLSSASTMDALEMLECINEAGIDGVMLTSPHYVKPSRAGAIRHFEMLASNTDLQVMLYSNKSRTGVEIDVEDACSLSSGLSNIVAIKDAESDIIRPLRMYKKSDLNTLTGNDENYLAFHAHGGKGIVSVVSNLIPKAMTSLDQMLESKRYEQARDLQCALFDIYDAIYSDTNPSGVKYAMSLLGLCKDYVSMPLVEVSEDTKKRIKEIMPRVQEIEAEARV